MALSCLTRTIARDAKCPQNNDDLVFARRSNLNDILQSIPGFEPEVARSLIVELPDLGSGDPAKLCSLAGVVPFNCDSGLFRGKRRIYGGRGTPRTVLYRAALTAVKCVKADNVFKQLYLRMTAKKPHKVGIVAVMHKMLIIAHSLVKNNQKWVSIP